MLLKQRVINIIESALETIGPRPADLPIKIEYARDEKFGDYACTLAMDKRWRDAYSDQKPDFKNPRNFAAAIVDALNGDTELAANFTNIEVAGAGFINLTLAPELFALYNTAAREDSESYGRSESSAKRKIILEYVSANPTGPLNVVSARAAALGDACANLLEAAGEEVYREYYVNDYGNQVNLMGRSCMLRYLESQGVTLKFAEKQDGELIYQDSDAGLPFPGEGYHGEYVRDVASVIAEDHPDALPDDKTIAKLKKLSEKKKLKDADYAAEVAEYDDRWGRLAATFLLQTQRMDLEEFRVRFDNFYSERGLHEGGHVAAVGEKIKDHLFNEDGKWLFRSSDFGDDKDRVVVRDDGRPTYLLADIAYHNTKIERGFREVIDIWGPDHHGYIARLKGAMRALDYDGFQVKIAQQINLLENGEPIVMSKRTGKFITMETLMEEIPVDVLRYFFVMRSFDSHLDFDLVEARDTSPKNPYYYVAYAHARICSIFRECESLDKHPTSVEDMELTVERRRLLWFTARFPEEVAGAAQEMEPHRMITFLYSMANAFSKFYEDRERNKVKDLPPEIAGQLLALIGATRVCLKNGLALLGMEAPERMAREEQGGEEGSAEESNG